MIVCTVHPANDVDDKVLMHLRDNLTNHSKRGDVHDMPSASSEAGSDLQERIDDRFNGYPFSPGSYIVLARKRTAIVGWCLMRPDVDIDHRPWDLLRSKKQTINCSFYVAPAARGLGVGKLLFQEARETARKTHVAKLTAYPWNKSSDLFFASVGFRNVLPYVPGVASGTSVIDL